MAEFCFHYQNSATKNKDIQRKHIGTRGIIEKSELVPGLGTEIYRVKRSIWEEKETLFRHLAFIDRAN